MEPNSTTDPINADTDGDGRPDGVEDANGNGRVDLGETNPRDTDTDRDGLSDNAEDPNQNNLHEPELGETDPTVADTDGGGVIDGIEVNMNFTDPNDPSDDDRADVTMTESTIAWKRWLAPTRTPKTDGDTISDADELEATDLAA